MFEKVESFNTPEFSITVNGVEVTQANVVGFPMYSAKATTMTLTGSEMVMEYEGFCLKDIFRAAGLTGKYIWMEAKASDGYIVKFTGDIIMDETTLLAMKKDGSEFLMAPWLAPCLDTSAANYVKEVVSILVNTTNGPPALSGTPATSGTPGSDNPTETPGSTDSKEFRPFAFSVNGQKVTNETLKNLSTYEFTVTVTRNDGSTVVENYAGYRLYDVLALFGAEHAANVDVVASDGYKTSLPGGTVVAEDTLVAIEKDGEPGEGGTVWIAPCGQSSAKSYARLVLEITAE